MARAASFPQEVIPDEYLRDLAERRSHRMVLVLVEPRRPAIGRTLDWPHGATSPLRIEVTRAERDGSDREALVSEIFRITGHTPSYLPAAGAFVTEASGEQLAELATLPWVATIRPSRHVHVCEACTV